jgi:hypothetical protein
VDAGSVEPFAPLGDFLAGISGYHHYVERLLRDVPQICQNRKAIHLRHVNVNDENIGLMLTGLDQGLEPAGGGFDVEAHPGASVGDRP